MIQQLYHKFFNIHTWHAKISVYGKCKNNMSVFLNHFQKTTKHDIQKLKWEIDFEYNICIVNI